jgi:hypothetical protein
VVEDRRSALLLGSNGELSPTIGRIAMLRSIKLIVADDESAPQAIEPRPIFRPAHSPTAPAARFLADIDRPTTPALDRHKGILATIAAAGGVAALYIWDDLLLAAPVIAVTTMIGPLKTWLVFAAIYAVLSLLVATLAVRAYDRFGSGRPSRLASWLEVQTQHSRSVWVQRLVSGTGALGFIFSSVVLGGIVTTWLLRYSGITRKLKTLSVLSCAIFGLGFAGQYAGVTGLFI